MSDVILRKLAQKTRLTANANCGNCYGLGLEVSHAYHDVLNRMDVQIRVCKCVRVRVVGTEAQKLIK